MFIRSSNVQSYSLSCYQSLYIQNINKNFSDTRSNFRLLYNSNVLKNVKINHLNKTKEIKFLYQNDSINFFKLKKNNLKKYKNISILENFQKNYFVQNIICNETSFYVYLDYKSILNNTDFINWIFKQGSLKFFLYDIANINNNTDEKLFDCSDKLECGFFVFKNFVRVMILEENQLQFFVSKLRDNILLLEKLYFFSNIVKHSRDLILLVNQKNYLKTKTFKFKVHLCKELFQLPWKLLCEQRYIKKINKTILFDFYSALALNKFYISEQFDNLKKIGFLDVRLKLFNNKLDLYINSQNKIMLKLLRSRTLILKNALMKHGVFLRTVSINK